MANADDGLSYKVDSVVYSWEAGKFKEFQRIPTKGVEDTHYFTIGTRKMVSFSNSMYGIYEVSIYEWENEQFNKKIQDIPMTYPKRCNTFTIHNITYMACGKGITADTVTVLKWSGKQFESFQDLPSAIVRGGPHIIHTKSTVYLTIANYKMSGNNLYFDIDSFIYRWSGNKFVHHQSIPTHGAKGCDSFTVKDEMFLVVANYVTRGGIEHKVESAVYKMADNKFNLYQQLPTMGASYVHAFTHKGKQYLAVANGYNGISYNMGSAVYIWN